MMAGATARNRKKADETIRTIESETTNGAVQSSPISYDVGIAQQLWEVSENLTGLNHMVG